MIRGVHTALGHPCTGPREECPKRLGDSGRAVPTPHRRGRRHVVHDKTGIGRRVEVGREQVDVAVHTLRPFQKPGGQADPVEQGDLAVERRPWMHEGGGTHVDGAARRPRRMQADRVGDAAAVRAGRVDDLRRQHRTHGRVVARDGRVDDRLECGGLVRAGRCRRRGHLRARTDGRQRSAGTQTSERLPARVRSQHRTSCHAPPGRGTPPDGVVGGELLPHASEARTIVTATRSTIRVSAASAGCRLSLRCGGTVRAGEAGSATVSIS